MTNFAIWGRGEDKTPVLNSELTIFGQVAEPLAVEIEHLGAAARELGVSTLAKVPGFLNTRPSGCFETWGAINTFS